MHDRASDVTAVSHDEIESTKIALEDVSERVSAIAQCSSAIQRQYKQVRQRRKLLAQLSALLGHNESLRLYDRARRTEEQAMAVEQMFADVRHRSADDKVQYELYNTLQSARDAVHDLALRSVPVLCDDEPPEEFLCSICIDLLYHPVTLNCEHRFCEHCVHLALKNDAERRCPLCRRANTAADTYEEDAELHWYLKKTYPTLYKLRKAERTTLRRRTFENELTLYELRLQKTRWARDQR